MASARDLDPQAAAVEIETARRRAAFVEPFTARFGTIELLTAYDVMERASALRVAETGARRVGRKIGFTNRTIWERYGVHHPIWGWMYDDSAESAAGAEADVDLNALVQPRVEPEIVVRLARAVSPGASVAEIATAIEWVAFGFEIVQCHYAGWRFRPADTIIDGSLHGASRIGEPTTPWPGMADDLARFTLTLRRNGEPIDHGNGANVLGSALHAVAHLATVVGPLGIAAGEILTTGTVTDAAIAAAGDRYTVDIEGLPLAPLALTCS